MAVRTALAPRRGGDVSELSQVGMSERSEAMAGARQAVIRPAVTRLVVTSLSGEAS